MLSAGDGSWRTATYHLVDRAGPASVRGVAPQMVAPDQRIHALQCVARPRPTSRGQLSARLAHLRKAGVKISLDGFGIGFSNLSQLARTPLDELKIDRSLIDDVGRSERCKAVIRAIVGMAQALGLRTIAEGIETTVQHEFVRALGCCSVQGYRFARRMQTPALEAWRREGEAEPAAA